MKTTTNVAAVTASVSTFLGTAVLGQQVIEIDTRLEAFDSVLGFEVPVGDALPFQWSAHSSTYLGGAPITTSNEAIALDREIFRSGRSAARITISEGTPGGFGVLILRIPIDFTGTGVELRGFLRTEHVSGQNGLFLNSPLTILNPTEGSMDPIEGSSEWAEYSVTAPIDPGAHTLFLGFAMLGHGTIWVDDLELLVDGRPLRELPRVGREPTDQEKEELIARAEMAGFPSITNDATIKTVYGLDIKVLREGSNGWTCWAETLGLGPMCNEPAWDAWLLAYWNNRASFTVDKLSISYMLGGHEGEPPHVMILVPQPEMLEGLSTREEDPVWAMWKGSPYAHIMLNTGDLENAVPFPQLGSHRTE